jgi:hypothetical protein
MLDLKRAHQKNFLVKQRVIFLFEAFLDEVITNIVELLLHCGSVEKINQAVNRFDIV